MIRFGLIFAACLLWGMHTLVFAQPEGDATRGALLYAAHCNACHTSKIHWREKKLATDMDSLDTQVRRWQHNIGQEWTEVEIADAVRCLDADYYIVPEGAMATQACAKIDNRLDGPVSEASSMQLKWRSSCR